MKIIAGQYGGRRLETPKNKDIRPTGDKVRGAIFNMLGARTDIIETRVLDAFCGSGALGLEALSRGAEHCVFIDKARTSLDLCKRNIETLGAQEQSTLHLKDSSKAIGTITHTPFDLIFLDPPYNKDLIIPTLTELKTANLMGENAYIVIETEKKWEKPIPDGLEIETEKIYGDTKIMVARYNS